ncbi:MAG: hypothetical protein AB7T38_03095 [Nitrospirales bacterium]
MNLGIKKKAIGLASILLPTHLQDTVRKLKQARELRSRDQAQIKTLENKLANIERKYRQSREAASKPFSDFPISKVIDLVREIAESTLDEQPIQQRIASYHSALGKKGYDFVWRERMQSIQQVIESGETDLMRALQIVRGHEENRRKMGLETRRWVINDKYMELPWRPAAAAYRSAVFEAVLAVVRSNTTKIIETGSGWGEHLCNIFLNGGPYDATYYACELEEEGRKCALMLAALNPIFRLEARFFDYLNPDYSRIPTDGEHTILLTAHSVEQVSHIHENCIEGVLNLGKQVNGIHFEPMGWQTQKEKSLSEVSQVHRNRCLDLHYNENLWPLLKKIEGEGRIKILKCVPNMIGLDYNPATLIVWEKMIED